jgi:hypothetical protein
MNLIEHSHLQAMDEFSLSENLFGKLSSWFDYQKTNHHLEIHKEKT